jgi:S1-C subfamily serine protease/pSer/pThr/pTyr-binding forkhead associated (FHA) protein
MATSKARIAIRHLSGSKVNQIEQFDLDGLQEITIGREPSSRIAYDLQRDDEVSRKHAVIRIKNGAELYFRIADLNSSNGTFLNGERIAGEVELLPEDIVELGSTGPKFIFDVQPRPANLPPRTRQMTATDAAAATRIVPSSGKAGATAEQAVAETRQRIAALDTATGAKVPVGKATILRLLSDERRKASHIWIGLTAAIAVLAIVGGGVFYMHSRSVAQQLEQELATATAHADSVRQETDARLAKEMGITPKDIKRLGDSTVYVVNSWQLYDRETNRPLYQKMVRIEHRLLPAYVRLSNNEVVRWLTLEQTKDDIYHAIGDRHSGSGFVANKDGFILTNAHVAAAWSWRVNDYRENNWTNGAVYSINDRPGRYRIYALNQLDDLSDWIPGNGGYVFEASRPRLISSGRRDFFGRNDILTVRFPGTRTDFNATLIRTSPDSDLAEIKVEAGATLSSLDLAEDGTVEAGEKVILLGYPNVSQESYGLEETNAGGMNRVRRFYIPEPTVTQGIVSKLPAMKKKDGEGAVKIKDTFGEMYQLDIFAGPGSSGGPVLNSSGKVIGLLSMGRTDAEHVSFAVPVSGVRELLQAQRSPQH